jgi:long-chain acyl-CoA synthetase
MMTKAPGNAPAAKTKPSPPWLSQYPAGVDWHMPLSNAPLYRLLDDTVAKFGKLNCTNFLGKRLTYAEIGEQVDRATAVLQRLGVGKGTKVGLFLPNSPTFIIYFFAVLKAGGTVVNYNPLYTVRELADQVEDSDTDLSDL